MRQKKWTEIAINKAFDDFVKQHDRLPTKQEMYKEYNGDFPRPLSLKLTLGITVGEYLKLRYPEYLERYKFRVYGKMPKEYWIDNFKKQYVKYNCPIEAEYNMIREHGTPNTKTLTKIIGVSTWAEMLDYCGFQKDKKNELQGETVFEETLENYKNLNIKLKEILKNLR